MSSGVRIGMLTLLHATFYEILFYFKKTEKTLGQRRKKYYISLYNLKICILIILKIIIFSFLHKVDVRFPILPFSPLRSQPLVQDIKTAQQLMIVQGVTSPVTNDCEALCDSCSAERLKSPIMEMDETAKQLKGEGTPV